MAEIDLDALAAGYEYRPTTSAAGARAAAAADAASLRPGSLALDVGGGRGSHAGVFAARGAQALVVDRSPAMARAAHAAKGVTAVVGDAGCLPVKDAACDLVYFHLSMHYGDWPRAMAEAWRVCKPGGRIWVWTFHPEHHRSSFIARWFPSVAGIDEARFPEPEAIGARLSDLGCVGIATGDAPERVERTVADWREAVEGGFISTLQMLPPGEIELGLQRFGEAHPDSGETLCYDLLFCSVSAVRPSLR
jgi:demethylmenaquinone methyltransferase/2-methoxy-6-polyprenyl-1,4-benzoquinol methylase